MPSGSSDEPLILEDDGLYTPEIKLHSLEKIRHHNRYARIFASGMRKKWPQLAYIGLFSGAGRARVKNTGEIRETSALAVLRQPTTFTHYVYVDNDPKCVEALQSRIERDYPAANAVIIPGDVNECADAVIRALPRYSANNGLLSFCFVDPFDLQVRFDTIRQLSRFRMDFLVLLMLGVDGRRNFDRYWRDLANTRISDLTDCPHWRELYRPGQNIVPFLLARFDEAMARLGYLISPDEVHSVTVAGMGVFQYALAFYSKSEMGRRFWKESRASLNQQLGLSL